jgi:hypothetical protein
MYCTQHLHGTTAAAEQGLRGRALIRDSGLRSPAERLNGMQYRPEVLQNLLISASLGGYRILPRRA